MTPRLVAQRVLQAGAESSGGPAGSGDSGGGTTEVTGGLNPANIEYLESGNSEDHSEAGAADDSEIGAAGGGSKA